jgi:hypothetical protein
MTKKLKSNYLLMKRICAQIALMPDGDEKKCLDYVTRSACDIASGIHYYLGDEVLQMMKKKILKED